MIYSITRELSLKTNLLSQARLQIESLQLRVSRVDDVDPVGRVALRDAQHQQLGRVRRAADRVAAETVDLHQLQIAFYRFQESRRLDHYGIICK